MRFTRRTLTLVTLGAVPLFAGGWMLQSRARTGGPQLLGQVMDLVANRFVDTVQAPTLYEKAARGLVRELEDPYTELFTPKQIEEFSRNTSGRYAGLGMEITEQSGWVTVARVFHNTPAEEAGIEEGDRIVQIDTASTRNFKTTQVQNLLIGAPGTKVKVSFQRPGVAALITDTFTRRPIQVPAVRFSMAFENNSIGYIPVDRFSEQTSSDVSAAIKALEAKGAKSVVIDLRDNPGGILEQAIEMSNLFLRRGQPILSVRDRGGEGQGFSATQNPIAPTIPLVVLVNGGSASASEIVAGALQDHDRALVVGTTSYGKGLVQTVFPLDGGYALKMTTAKWYTPSGRSIQKERKLIDGQFVETHPDSLESDSAKKARPTFRSDAGRVVYGGGAITPDVVVRPDTMTTAEQTLARGDRPACPRLRALDHGTRLLAQGNAAAELHRAAAVA